MNAAIVRAAVRHFFAWATTTGTWLLVWTAVYLFLFIWALLADEPVGSPLAYPLGLLAVVLFHSLAVLLLFLPATLLSEFACQRKALSRLRGGLPIAVLSFVLCSGVAGLIFSVVDRAPEPGALDAFLALAFALCIPMGFYWWVSQFPSFLHLGLRKLFHRSGNEAE